MDNKYYSNVIAEMKSFIDENGFKSDEKGFSNGKKAFTVNYDDNRQMYTLCVADISEDKGEIGEYTEINAWLFDDSQNEKDAQAVGIDFTNSLKKELGIKAKRNTSSNQIDLPKASKGDSINISGFAKKMLDVFPSLKDDYKEHIASYGNFLYINFFGKNLVPLLKNLFESNNKKQIKKLYDVFENVYIKGDRDTINTLVAILCAASYKNDTATASIREMLSDNSHFLAAYNNFIPVFAKNKKLLKALVL